MKKIIFLSILVLSFCSKSKEKALVTVNNEKLTAREFKILIPQYNLLTKEDVENFIENWIDMELVYQKAKKEGFLKNETLKVKMEAAQKDFIVNYYIQTKTANILVSQQEILDYYNKHKKDFLYQVKIQYIILPDMGTAESVYKQLLNGANFKKLTSEVSMDKSVNKGEPTPYFGRGMQNMDPLLEETIFSMKVGEISKPIKTMAGYYIVKLVDKKQFKKSVDFNEVANYIRYVLIFKKRQQMLDSMIAELRKNAKIKKNIQALYE